MQGDRGCEAARSQMQSKEGVGRQNPETELLELGFVCTFGNINGE
jgi:hypothetical protein